MKEETSLRRSYGGMESLLQRPKEIPLGQERGNEITEIPTEVHRSGFLVYKQKLGHAMLLRVSIIHALSSFIREGLQEFQTGIEEVIGTRENLSASVAVILKTLSRRIPSFLRSAMLEEVELIKSANQIYTISDSAL
jgi:hypothetical protein